jgi:hypothetical protein
LRANAFGDREKFVHNLICGMHHRDAYVAAGFADYHSSGANALRMMRDPVVSARLDWLLREVREREGLELVLRRRRLIAVLEGLLGERADMFDNDGILKPLDQLTPQQRGMIDSIRPTKAGREAIMPSRLAAAQLLARLEGFEAPSKSEQSVHVTREDARLTDVELARWIAAKLEDGAAIPALPSPGGDGKGE